MALAAAEIPRRQPRTLRRYPELADQAWLRRRHLDENASAVTSATELGCTDVTVRRALSNAGIYRDGRKRGRGRYPQLADPAWLRQRHVLDGARAEDIAAELGCDPSAVRAALRAAGIPRLGRARAQLQLADHQWLRRRYLQDCASIQQIATELSCHLQGRPARPRGG